MKVADYFLILTLAVLAANCAHVPTSKVQPTVPQLDRNARLECKEKGGVIKRVCRLQSAVCVVAYSDAGKRCSDKSQCKGKCLLEFEHPVEVRDSVKGRCQIDNNPCGCQFEVIGGKLAGGACAD
jgi:hypothetical protein